MKIKFNTCAFELFCLFFLVSACNAEDLGSAGDYYFDLKSEDVEKPKWDHGIRDIVEKKCATCHNPGNRWFKPQNVPAFPNSDAISFGLNYMGEKSFFSSDNPLMQLVKKCIETKDARCGKDNVPMPPSYATPLSDNERQALVAFVSALIPTDSLKGLSLHF